MPLDVEALPPAIKDPWGNARRGVTARGRISRKEWGLQWNLAIEPGGVAVGDEVGIEIEAGNRGGTVRTAPPARSSP